MTWPALSPCVWYGSQYLQLLLLSLHQPPVSVHGQEAAAIIWNEVGGTEQGPQKRPYSQQCTSDMICVLYAHIPDSWTCSQESWGDKAQEVLLDRRPFLQNPNSKWSISTNPASVSITQNDLSNGSIHLFLQQMFTEISARYCFRAWGVSSENIVALLSCNARQGKDQQQHRSGKYLLLSCK